MIAESLIANIIATVCSRSALTVRTHRLESKNRLQTENPVCRILFLIMDHIRLCPDLLDHRRSLRTFKIPESSLWNQGL